MPDFEQLNFKVEAQDNATKTLNKILKTLTELEKKMNGLSKFKMPNIGLTNQQIKLLNNWDKLDKKLQKVEKDLKSVGKVQKQLKKFEIVPKGKPLFTYDAATQSYIGNNLGVARRERQKIQKQLEEQGIKDIVKGWGKKQLLLPPPPEFKAYKILSNTSTVQTPNNAQTSAMLRDLEIYKDELEIIKQIDDYLRSGKHKISQEKITLGNVDEAREWHNNLLKEKKGLLWSELNIKNPILYRRKVNYADDGTFNTTSVYKQQIKDTEYTYEVIDDKIKNITMQTKKATKEANKLKDKFKGVSKFIKSIGKIVLYRAIRSAMAEIKKGIQSSQEDLAKFDSSYNETLSKLVTSLDVLRASMGLILRPFVEILEPVVGNIVDLFAQVGNYISYATSKAKGLSTYTKINAEYAKDYLESLQQANNLLSFDKFEVLQKQETKDIYEEASVADGIDASENVKDISNFLINGVTSLKSVINILNQILDSLKPLRLLEPLSAISGIVDGILNILEGLFTLNLDLINVGIERIIVELIQGIANIFIGFVNLWVKLFDFIFSLFGRDVDFKGLNYLDYKKSTIDKAINTANGNVYNNDVGSVKSSLDQQYSSNAVIEFDFKNFNNNAIARELANSMANQFQKQNIKIRYS